MTDKIAGPWEKVGTGSEAGDGWIRRRVDDTRFDAAFVFVYNLDCFCQRYSGTADSIPVKGPFDSLESAQKAVDQALRETGFVLQ